MPARDSLLLEVYDGDGVTLLWDVSSSPDHDRPFLLTPDNYGEHMIDPVTGGASIGTVEVGVVDAHQTPGDQTTGWMTERLADVRGHRNRLRRWGGDALGWHLIADGPAGVTRMDASYSAYRWPIRDTRETERKLRAFTSGGTTAIFPRGPVENFGDMGGGEWLLGAVVPIAGEVHVGDATPGIPGPVMGYVEFDGSFLAYPVANPAYVVGEDVEAAVAGATNGSHGYFPNADVLWRAEGSSGPWNVARPRVPANYIPSLALMIVDAGEVDGEPVRVARRAILFWEDGGVAPAGMPVDGARVELLIRYRGAASEEYPFYWQGTAGDLLEALYSGELARAPDLGGDVYDPAGLETTAALLAGGLRYDPAAIGQMDAPVLLRQMEPVHDARSWAESKIYGPAGWAGALDGEGRISPVSRERPGTLDGPPITDANAEPSPEWNAGERVVTSITYAYQRLFRPTYPALVRTDPDGLAVREVSITYRDPTAEVLEQEQAVDYDASAFSAIGDGAGNARAGDTEPAVLLAQAARYDVLQRWRAGAQAIRVRVRRIHVPTLRVGAWCPVQLSWIPNDVTGLRGSDVEAAQVIAIDDSEARWRYLLLEESKVPAAPGYFSGIVVVADEPAAGYFSDIVVASIEPFFLYEPGGSFTTFSRASTATFTEDV